MFIRSSDQLPSVTVLKRFPVPRNFNVSSESRIERGKTWHAPADATRVKKFRSIATIRTPGRTRGLIRTRSISTPAGAKIPTVVAIRFACFALAVAGTFAIVRIAIDG
jgi:hypothetical protein